MVVSFHRAGIGGGETYLAEVMSGLGNHEFWLCDLGENLGVRKLLSPYCREVIFPTRRVPKIVAYLEDLCEERSIDVVHFNSRKGIIQAAEMRKRYTVVTLHTNLFSKYISVVDNLKSGVWVASVGSMLQKVGAIVVPSIHSANVLMRVCNVPGDNVVVIPNGITAEKMLGPCMRDGEKRIVVISRLVKSKCVDVVIRAMLRFRGLARCDIYGGGPEFDSLHRLVTQLGLDKTVYLNGHVSRGEVTRAVQDAYAVVLPSPYEGCPYSLLEAMAHGKPIVVVSRCGLGELAGGGLGGILVEPQCVRGMADAIERLINSELLAREMGEFGFSLASTRFSKANMMEQMARVYRPVCNPDRML